MKPYEQALWEWFLSVASLHEFYGGGATETKLFRAHMETCRIDHEYSDLPHVGMYETFQGTFTADHQTAGVVVDRWRCSCGRYTSNKMRTALALSGEVSLSQLIYEVIQTGLGNSLLEQITDPEI